MCSQIPPDWLAERVYACSCGVVNVQPFTASPLTPVDGVHTKVSYPPKFVVIVTTSEAPPPQEVTLYEDKSNAGFGSIMTGTSTIGELQPNFAKKDRKSTRLNSSHVRISYAVFCLKKKN